MELIIWIAGSILAAKGIQLAVAGSIGWASLCIFWAVAFLSEDK